MNHGSFLTFAIRFSPAPAGAKQDRNIVSQLAEVSAWMREGRRFMDELRLILTFAIRFNPMHTGAKQDRNIVSQLAEVSAWMREGRCFMDELRLFFNLLD
ncbi:hypothetical protein [Pseudoalteromonas sp. OOF1S-7]|uniref:hypothetical protein n=1 Tax=Pseudoalteromonas sp. OOF1S-7 TaxID=2917757 RepID=UPI001EF6E4C9|nr:hypothetical protein [Pseudoalteromonas sp. OOF1S-7]MCG7536636.1 hypothetical protein [Pseudoalteromonas sp. OOF1S-7]